MLTHLKIFYDYSICQLILAINMISNSWCSYFFISLISSILLIYSESLSMIQYWFSLIKLISLDICDIPATLDIIDMLYIFNIPWCPWYLLISLTGFDILYIADIPSYKLYPWYSWYSWYPWYSWISLKSLIPVISDIFGIPDISWYPWYPWYPLIFIDIPDIPWYPLISLDIRCNLLISLISLISLHVLDIPETHLCHLLTQWQGGFLRCSRI